jgi:hypothetical protein
VAFSSKRATALPQLLRERTSASARRCPFWSFLELFEDVLRFAESPVHIRAVLQLKLHNVMVDVTLAQGGNGRLARSLLFCLILCQAKVYIMQIIRL